MNHKKIIMLVVIILTIFTILKIDQERRCKKEKPIRMTAGRPLIFEMYE